MSDHGEVTMALVVWHPEGSPDSIAAIDVHSLPLNPNTHLGCIPTIVCTSTRRILGPDLVHRAAAMKAGADIVLGEINKNPSLAKLRLWCGERAVGGKKDKEAVTVEAVEEREWKDVEREIEKATGIEF